MEERSPKIVENTKRVMLIKGGQTSEVVSQALKDIVSVFIALRTVPVFITRRTVPLQLGTHYIKHNAS